MKSTTQNLHRKSGMHQRLATALPHVIVVSIGLILGIKAIHADLDVGVTLITYGTLVTATVFAQFIVAFYLYEDPYVTAQKIVNNADYNLHKPTPLVSCLVAVYNEEQLVADCVESICAQDYANKEIIFVNDASTDRTASVLDDLMQTHPIKVLHLPDNVGKKRALGAAILASSGEIIAMSDSDSQWHPDAMTKMVDIFITLPRVGAVSGHARALNAQTNFITRVQDTWYEGQYSIRKAFESHFGAVTCVSGPLAVFRRDAIYNYIPAWTADRFLGQEFKFATDRTLTGLVLGARYVGRSIKAKHTDSPFSYPDFPVKNYRVVYSKATRAFTAVPETLASVTKQQVRWKKSFIRNTAFTGLFYWRKRALPALVYYLHVAFVLCGPFIVLRHLVYLPLQSTFDSALLYMLGNLFVGYMFGLAYKVEEPQSSEWICRPVMSLFSTLFLSWLIFYSAATIRKMRWHRG